MKIKHFVFLMLFACFFSSLNAQWTQSLQNLYSYHIKLNGIKDIKHADYITSLYRTDNNIFICHIDEKGDGILFSEKELNMKQISNRLAKESDIIIVDFESTTTSEDEYFNTYLKLYNPPVQDISVSLPYAVKINDGMKQSRAYSVFKTIWMKKYPGNYNKMFPEETDQSVEEKTEKIVKESK